MLEVKQSMKFGMALVTYSNFGHKRPLKTKSANRLLTLIFTSEQTEVKESNQGGMWSAGGVLTHLDRNYCYKLATIQIPQDAGLAAVPYTGKNPSLIEERTNTAPHSTSSKYKNIVKTKRYSD